MYISILIPAFYNIYDDSVVNSYKRCVYRSIRLSNYRFSILKYFIYVIYIKRPGEKERSARTQYIVNVSTLHLFVS